MTVFVVCSSGVLIRGSHGSVLVDAPNAPCNQFEVLAEGEFSKLLRSEYPYDLPLCIAFTHLHPDHYCEEKLHRVLDARPNTEVVLPSEMAQSVTVLGGLITIEQHPTAHVRAPGFDEIVHNVLWIAGEKSLYLTADCRCDRETHREILGGRKADLAFWNNQLLSCPESRALLLEAAKKNYIYHIPIDPDDTSGMRRKAERCLERYQNELPTTSLILSYPYCIESDA